LNKKNSGFIPLEKSASRDPDHRKGFTLLELVVVIVILSILVTLNTSRFYKIKETSIDKEAIANIKLIQTSEKARRFIDEGYASGADITALNSVLRLAIPTTTAYWNYKVDSVSTTVFTAKARRMADDNRVWWVNESSGDPNLAGSGAW
jgi:prepilin-type N-terminal cleavage/methylation domain-containing protein